MVQKINSSNKKSRKIIISSIIFLSVILVFAFFVYNYFLKNISQEKIKTEFFSKIQNNDLKFFMENKLYENINEKMENENYDSSSNIKISTTMENNMFSKLDLSKFEFNHNYTKNNNESKSFHTIKANYAGNHLLTIDIINNQSQFAIKSDEIVNKYVGMNKENIQTVANKIANTNVNLTDAEKLKDFLVNRQNLKLSEISEMSSFEKYGEILNKYMNAENFSKKDNVIITLDSEKVKTTEYTVNLSYYDVKYILSEGLEEFENNQNEIISKLTIEDSENTEEKGEIIEYKDNDNISEVSGQQNNFNTKAQVFVQNTSSNSITTSNNTETNTTNNTTTNSTTVNNTISNTTTNSITNQTTNENVNQVTNQNTVEVQNTVTNNTNVNEVEQNTPQINPNENQANNVEENTVSTPIEEDENLRTQGYISVNQNDENISETSEFIIGENYEETIKNISEFSENIDWTYYLITGAKANLTNEELTNIIKKIWSEKIKQNNSLIIKMYIAEDKMVKINFEIPETKESFGMEIISKGSNEKYLNFTKLNEQNDSNGYTASLYKKETDANVKLNINVNKIYKNKINEKTSINLNTKGTLNSKKYNTSLDVFYSNDDGEFEIKVENMLNFDSNTQVDNLNNENCLFIDQLSDEELIINWLAIKQKTINVLSEKNRNLNIIDINNSNSVVDQMGQNPVQEQNVEDKESAKQILIQTISNKMGQYLENGTELKLKDLENLEIPGYEVKISISSNLAIITVNGYGFKLDSDFNLSDS